MKRKGGRHAGGPLDKSSRVELHGELNPAFSTSGPAPFRRFAALLAGLIFLALGAETWGQIWVNPGGVGGPPPDRVAFSTNRLDLDVNGSTDFEIVSREDTTYVADFSGWVPLTTTTVSLVPLGGAQILAADQYDSFAGDLPALAENDVVGPAKAGWHWSATAHNLVTRSEPTVLFGPLASIWMGAPGKVHLGVSLGTPEAPIYAWLCFRGGFSPIYWGYARQAAVPAIAGDRSAAPPLKMKVKLINSPLPDWKWSVISWEPAFLEVTVEERVGLNGTWSQVMDQAIQTSGSFSVPVNTTTPIGELRLYRVRFGP